MGSELISFEYISQYNYLLKRVELYKKGGVFKFISYINFGLIASYIFENIIHYLKMDKKEPFYLLSYLKKFTLPKSAILLFKITEKVMKVEDVNKYFSFSPLS